MSAEELDLVGTKDLLNALLRRSESIVVAFVPNDPETSHVCSIAGNVVHCAGLAMSLMSTVQSRLGSCESRDELPDGN